MKGLAGVALVAATEFLAAHPDAVITSGRRGLVEQANAMARNVARAGRRWIAKTYAKPLCDAARACQAWVDAHEKATEPEIARGLLGVLPRFSRTQLAKLSRHFSGLAFDVQPVAGPRGEAMKATLRALAAKYGGLFLDREGGREIWHLQFPEAT